jgi:hypothetical protein
VLYLTENALYAREKAISVSSYHLLVKIHQRAYYGSLKGKIMLHTEEYEELPLIVRIYILKCVIDELESIQAYSQSSYLENPLEDDIEVRIEQLNKELTVLEKKWEN